MKKPRILKNQLALLLISGGFLVSHAAELSSPDGRILVNFQPGSPKGHPTNPTYSLAREGVTVIAPSQLHLDVAGGAWSGGLKVQSERKSSHDSTWKPVCGERAEIRDHYNQLKITLQETNPPHRILRLTFRAYDSGVAFRYTIPRQGGLKQVRILREDSEFRFPNDAEAWATYSAQGVYSRVPVSQIRSGCERPLPVRISDTLYLALGEARLVDYARMKFAPLTGVSNALVSKLDGPVEAELPLASPWRFIMVADSPGKLLENNSLVLNLNAPSQIADTSWIKAGKLIRDVTLTTTGAKACVDFAVRHNLQYVLFDAGWYGPENSADSDATAVTLDPKRSKGPLDLPAVIRYGNKHGIGVILYVNQHALSKQLDEILPLYHQWGVKGVKYGFVQVGSQKHTAWLHDAIRKAATNHLMLDIHDEYRPTGYRRTYPNLMTMEGILGDEGTPTPAQDMAELFSRMLAGPADHTVCYFDVRVAKKWGHAYQLAKAVCFFSPWQSLYWYDRPANSYNYVSNGNAMITEVPELKFFDALPTTWDETKVLYGSIGKYAVIARRHDKDWFVGAMNSGRPRTFEVSFKFLPPGKKYLARIYSDDPAVNTSTHVRIEQRTVDSRTVLKCDLPADRGEAMQLTLQR